jgi:hypothetical protein
MLAAIGLDDKGERADGGGAARALMTAGTAGVKSNNWWS